MQIFIQLILILVLVISLLFLINKSRKNDSKQPPGPPGTPIIGNLYEFISSTPHLYFHELSKTYGPLMSLKLGFIPTLVVSSAKMAREVMKTHDHISSSRPRLVTHQKISYNCLDLVFTPYNDHWREIKKLWVFHLFGSKRVQSFSSIKEDEVHRMAQELSRLSAEGKQADLSELMTSLTSSIICRIAFGRRYDGYDAICGRNFRSMLRDVQEMLMMFCFSDYFPFMGWVDKLTGKSARLNKVCMEFDRFYEEIIDDHLDPNRLRSSQEDMVDVLLKLRGNKSFKIDITIDHIKALLMNIFVAGTDTSAATLVWAMRELIENPEAMNRVQQETRTLMGSKTRDIIKEEDIHKLVYLKAVVKETMRLHPVAPMLVPRATTERCNIEGYEIQEKTLVFVNVHAIGRDPGSWENPEEFNPERFLGKKEIDFKGQQFELIPFGSGRRICPGLQLGASTVELALSNLIYLFNWSLPEGMEEQVMDTSVLPGIAVHKKYPLCLMPKQASQNKQ